MKFVRTFLLPLIVLLCHKANAQNLFAGASFRPHLANLLADENNREGDYSIRNIDFNLMFFSKNNLVFSVIYNQGNIIDEPRKITSYSLDYKMLKLGIGSCHKIERKRTNYYGYLFGVNIAPTNYNFSVSLSDPFGTTYSENHHKRITEIGLELGLFADIQIVDILYFKAYTGLTLTNNFSNHFSGAYPKYSGLPFYTPVGGFFPFFNILFSAGLAAKIK